MLQLAMVQLPIQVTNLNDSDKTETNRGYMVMDKEHDNLFEGISVLLAKALL